MNVVVTGASSGIGEETARAFARLGASVGLIARRVDLLESIAADIRRAGTSAEVAAADVGSRRQLEGALASLRSAMGPVDVLVNNAGMPGGATFADLTVEQIEEVTRVNLLGTMWATKAVLPDMLARRTGAIVNVASVAGTLGVPRAGAYAATKHGVVGLTTTLTIELASRGVSVILVNPGPVRTASWPHRNLAARLVLEPGRIAEAIVRAVARGTPEVTIPRYYRLAEILRAVAPPLYRSMVHRSAARTPPANG